MYLWFFSQVFWCRAVLTLDSWVTWRSSPSSPTSLPPPHPNNPSALWRHPSWRHTLRAPMGTLGSSLPRFVTWLRLRKRLLRRTQLRLNQPRYKRNRYSEPLFMRSLLCSLHIYAHCFGWLPPSTVKTMNILSVSKHDWPPSQILFPFLFSSFIYDYDSTCRCCSRMLIGPIYSHHDIKMLFKLSYWLT